MSNTLNIQRYARNLLIDEIGEFGQQKLLQSKVLVAGAGGLGSTVLANLASVGVGSLGVVDADRVELSNLNRQYIHMLDNIGKNKTESAKEWINAYNKDINVDTFCLRLTEKNIELLQDYDVIVDCFDSFESKFELAKMCIKLGKPFVHAGVTEFSGQVMTVIPNKTACLYCLFPEPKIDSFVVKGIISPTVSFAASIQASETIKLLLDFEEKLLVNCMFSFNLLDNEFRKINVRKNTQCPICSKH